jgi:ATP-dependent phosphofructokinase / diphosphate-dependent phosphofructokinase
MKKRVLVLTGGGDCPGLNAVIRAIVKRAQQTPDWEIIGSIEAFNGVLSDPMEVMVLDNKAVAGIHVRGGTIIKTTNKGNPMNYPETQPDGTVVNVDITDRLIERIRSLGVQAVISIGGDGSQRISQHLHLKGLPIIGVPKTIDNDLAATDFTFGFQTAVQIATESFDKLVTTAESHHRVIIMEVMGRSAGWIALHAAIAGGAEVCLIPEIPYDIAKVAERINARYSNGKGFAHIVIAEGAKPLNGSITARKSEMQGYENLRLGGVAYQLSQQLRDAGCTAEIRETVLGHLQRGGTPSAFDRVLATLFGVKAFEMVLDGQFGQMVAYKNNSIVTVPIETAVANYKVVNVDSYVIQAARGVGVSFGD